MTTVHPAAIAGATLIAIEPALECHGVVQPLQELHPVFLATLRKGVEGLFRCTDGFSGVDLVCHGDLADNLVVGRVHQIDDLRSMGSDELAVDIGAIKGSYWSRGFTCFHLCHPS